MFGFFGVIRNLFNATLRRRLVLIFYVSFEGWGVSRMTLSKLSILFNNSLLLSPTPFVRILFFLSSLIFCFASSLALKGLNKGFSVGTSDKDSS